ncbi:MAG: cytochrome b/b6 domain-containing protein [bacterium]
MAAMCLQASRQGRGKTRFSRSFPRESLRPLRPLCVLLLSLLLQSLTTLPADADDAEGCLFCHRYRGLSTYEARSGRLRLFFVQPEYVSQRLGPHALLACTDCHPRSEVDVVPHEPVTKVSCSLSCHLGNPGGQQQLFSHANVAEMLGRSVHSQQVLSAMEVAGGRLLQEGQSECLYCHDEPIFRDPTGAIPALEALGSRTFDRCDVCHLQQIPADIAYYLRHIAARLQAARPSLELAQVCSVCHSDPVVMAKHEMHDAVASYLSSYHGKAALLGDGRTADCLSCHIAAGANAHLMLRKDEPASSAQPGRVADACRNAACHPGADIQIGAAGVHLDLPSTRGTIEFWVAMAFIGLTLATFGPSMVLCVLELFSQVIGRHAHDGHMERLTREVLARPEGRRRLVRFTPAQRIQHWVLVILFVLLAVTGFPLKFADRDWAQSLIGWFEGLETARRIHHWAGLVLVACLVMHLAYVLITLRQRRARARAAGENAGLAASVRSLPMWVNPRDGRDMSRLLAHLLRLRRERPAFDRFSVKEKFEYIGVFWGTVVLGLTGALLWGEQISSHFLSGRVLNIALIAHTYEAFLAVIHVGILHIVNVMLAPSVFPLSPATLTGQTPVRELAEGHAAQVLRVARELGISTGDESTHGM